MDDSTSATLALPHLLGLGDELDEADGEEHLHLTGVWHSIPRLVRHVAQGSKLGAVRQVAREGVAVGWWWPVGAQVQTVALE